MSNYLLDTLTEAEIEQAASLSRLRSSRATGCDGCDDARKYSSDPARLCKPCERQYQAWEQSR